MRIFNIAGPCNKRQHYMIDAAKRIQGIDYLIDSGNYFVLHAARQSGKTTFIQDLALRLNAEGKYYAVSCSLESLQGITDATIGIPALVRRLRDAIDDYKIPNSSSFAANTDFGDFTGVIKKSISDFCKRLDKPLVILFDEADCLSESTLIIFLRQLRDGHNNRNFSPFAHSVALIGMRNIRDYKARIRPESQTLGSASPFNIVTEILTLTNFTKE
ncbi:MAG: ATP-binding protein, partial [Dysgonamonadaceae bacterium]|nr:ATP-binding protein [Dysgonamonadaceae bacterium]